MMVLVRQVSGTVNCVFVLVYLCLQICIYVFVILFLLLPNGGREGVADQLSLLL